ncbi:MAG: hypothetical protein ACRDRX_21665 [Pseudonocardiaceae bacterium]
MGQLHSSVGLLDATCSDRLRLELFSAVGDLADVAGYIAVDANAHEQGRRAYRFALACAEEAKDWPLRAEVLSSMAKQAIWTGQPDEGLTLAEHALVRPDRLTAAVRALLHTDRGRALAKMRRINETLTAIGTADDHFAHVTPDNEPPFAICYDEARHAQLTGQPLADLAILGRDLGEATDRLATAAAGHTVSNTRARAVCLGVGPPPLSPHDRSGGYRCGTCCERVCGYLNLCSRPRFRLAARSSCSPRSLRSGRPAGPPLLLRGEVVCRATAVGALPRRRPSTPVVTRPGPLCRRRGSRAVSLPLPSTGSGADQVADALVDLGVPVGKQFGDR